MSYQVALSFEDGVTRFITCGPHETVAEASYRSRINIPLDCRDGACGTCKSRCVSGAYDGGDYIEDALTDDEAAEGFALPCQMTPHSDLVLEIPATSAFAKTGAATHAGSIIELQRLSASTAALTVELDDRDQLAFLPGQYVNVTVPGTEATRSYSFRTGPAEKAVSFLVRITEGGAMSDYLGDRAEVGDRLEFAGPLGSFFLRDLIRPVLMLAGGTGLAPLLSMLERLTDAEVTHPVHLIYGVSSDTDLVELDKLSAYAEAIPRFSFDYCVADETSSAPNKGYVTGLLTPEVLHGGEVDVYLCGPPPMVEAVRGHLRESGLNPANFYTEKFTVAAEVGR
ncbi:benzoate 1,2-dioxygenase electron transfer component BenC [Saccharopolyspora phatthalungensis]|uniref:Benzoate/toluate 1,2-dioxygenase reductase subunit n=1 Tax=Saccharopolyspora phatthalungensis TaxID=664693 RepID=A0A840QJZ9_9PSEU|nr:benzoate 1,2-dioxygenase electron transfer component BenC [Saccharopolyspora phatthalungensis]MBB5159798.1 benzoate/toluate 1,2-dioxygenase reductase subunit [Saccharopolyspora phatthalungensis]